MNKIKSTVCDAQIGSVRYFNRELTNEEVQALWDEHHMTDPRQAFMDDYLGGIGYDDAVKLLKEHYPEKFI